MHIPDGYLSPQTTVPVIFGMLPVWGIAMKKVKEMLSQRQIPLLALCAAFSFVIMMFNVPMGESSVHAIGGVFIAILIGPWAACLAVSIALIIQAFVFGDGGILAIGANCFIIAFAMPFTGYYLYKLIAGKASLTSKRGLVAIFAGGYVGLNIAALLTAIAFGIQPLLFTSPEGIPLYGYYPLSVAVPVMMLEHLLLAGPVEGIITVGAVLYIEKFAPHLLEKKGTPKALPKSFFARYKALFYGILAMVILTPLGLLATGTAWGEWGSEELMEKIGYLPMGFERFSEIWTAWIPDYTMPGMDGSFLHSSLGYILSALVGILLIGFVSYLSYKFVVREQKD